MLEFEGLPAHKYAYDRPSPKLLGFLRKHFNLTQYSPQANNFVIYNEFFKAKPAEPTYSKKPARVTANGNFAQEETKYTSAARSS